MLNILSDINFVIVIYIPKTFSCPPFFVDWNKTKLTLILFFWNLYLGYSKINYSKFTHLYISLDVVYTYPTRWKFMETGREVLGKTSHGSAFKKCSETENWSYNKLYNIFLYLLSG